MPLRRTIGISLVCFATSACVMGQTPEERTSAAETTDVRPESAEAATDKSPRSVVDADACGGILERSCGLVRAVGNRQFGKAAWYDLVGNRTASGEILDTIHPTAAHRSLPLASLARVTKPGQRPFGHCQNQRWRPLHSWTHPRRLAACCRCARHEACWGGGRRR